MSTYLDYLLFGYNKNPRSKKRLSTYIKQRKLLSKFVKFNFRNTKNFTPSQKVIITKTIKKYRSVINAVRRNEARFVIATPTQIRSLKSKLISTNKGVFIYERNVTNIKIKTVRRKRKITAILKYRRGKRKEMFLPLQKGELIDDFAEKIKEEFNPQVVLLGIREYVGKKSYNPETFEEYIIELYREFKRKNKENLITGAYLIWIKPSKKKKPQKGQVFDSTPRRKRKTKKKVIKRKTKKKSIKRKTKKKTIKRKTKKKVIKRKTKKKVIKRK